MGSAWTLICDADSAESEPDERSRTRLPCYLLQARIDTKCTVPDTCEGRQVGKRSMNSTEVELNLEAYAAEVASAAQVASRALALATGEQIDRWLRRAAALVRERTGNLI